VEIEAFDSPELWNPKVKGGDGLANCF
jgi:hypothetical protein